MADGNPLWRQGFDRVEGALAPRLESLASNEQFAVAVGLAARLQRTAQRRMTRTSRQLLHLANLPAGTDIARILTEIGQLERQLRELSKRVEAKEAETDERHTRPARSPRSRPS